MDDEIEFDLDNQVEVQKIRNLRRTVISTMYNLKPEEKKYEEEINFSNIEYSLSESVMSSTEKIANLIPDNGKEFDSNTFNIDNEIIPKDKNEEKIKKMSKIPGISKIEEDKGEIKELKSLNNLYDTDKFEFAVIYGRRRVGKTALINQFIGDKKAIYFMGVESNEKQNLENLSRSIIEFTSGIEADTVFSSFQSSIEYIFTLAKKEQYMHQL